MWVSRLTPKKSFENLSTPNNLYTYHEPPLSMDSHNSNNGTIKR